MSLDKVKALIDRIISAAAEEKCNLLETRQACKSVYVAANTKIVENAKAVAAERADRDAAE